MKIITNLSTSLLLLVFSALNAQKCSTLDIQFKADIPSTCAELPMTMRQDAAGRPYLYVAKKEGGLEVYDISQLTAPVLKKEIPISLMSNLQVMNLSQQGNYLYLALGQHFNNNETPGMAIVDVSNPEQAVLTDVWVSGYSGGGAGIVKAEGDYAYLGAMGNGLVILDITDKSNITFVSKIIPDINYPTANPNPDLYNARGMEVKNGTVYLCYDAGGLRIINTSDKNNPVETGHFSNPVMNGKPRAYNNIVLDDTLVYIAVDYCGLEVLSVADPANIKLVSWWNPWNCQTNPANWFSSPGHANEIEFDKQNRLLFISTGKSDLHVVNIANPTAPDSCTLYGGVSNNIGTWGVGIYDEKIFLSYICAIVPFSSNWAGIKILTYNRGTSGIKNPVENQVKVYPQPATEKVTIETDMIPDNITLTNLVGQEFTVSFKTANAVELDVSALPSGVYFIFLKEKEKTLTAKFIKN